MPQDKLLREQHIKYIASLDNKVNDYEYWLSEHLRLNGVYWGLTALCILNSKDTFKKDDVVDFVLKCWDPKYGGFGPFPRHESHLLATLSGIQILSTYCSLDVLKADGKLEKIVKFIKGNQLNNGSFQGDRFGEVDSRFVYVALSSLSILGELTEEIVEPAVQFILRCYNFDGGFGLCPGAESHAAQAFTCLAALNVCNRLNALTKEQIDETGWWLCERQVSNGGLNGRPSKLPDVCYSWWVLSSLSIIDRLDWIDFDSLQSFILEAQDSVKGGISDRPENEVDVYHTVFGLAGLSLMGSHGLDPIDPTYCMPVSITSTFKKFPYIQDN